MPSRFLAGLFTMTALLTLVLTSTALTLPKQDISKNIPQSIEISESQPTRQPTPTMLHIVTPVPRPPQPIAGAIGPVDYPENVNPLTGLTVDDPATLNRRPMVVKISNSPPLVRPQAGIGMADIVFEHYTEGGVTRFSAVFYGQSPERVGSIRSARLIDHELTAMFHGILAFSGASIGVEKYIYGSDDVENRIDGAENTAPFGFIPPSEYADRAYKGVLYGRPYYWRDETIPVPHNMFTSPLALWELATSENQNQRPELRGLAFHPDAPPASTGEANLIDLRYRTTRINWTYDAENGVYARFADGQPHFDANTETQVTAANVVVLYAEHTDTEIIESQFGDSISPSVQIAVWGEGDAILFRDGKAYIATWVRTVREDIISLRTEEGDELLYLKPGNTWFQVVQLPEQQIPEEEWLIIE